MTARKLAPRRTGAAAKPRKVLTEAELMEVAGGRKKATKKKVSKKKATRR